MASMNPGFHARVAVLIAWVFVLLMLTPSFSLAQDPYDEIPRLQNG